MKLPAAPTPGSTLRSDKVQGILAKANKDLATAISENPLLPPSSLTKKTTCNINIVATPVPITLSPASYGALNCTRISSKLL
jgi:hypothetical protein